VHRVMYGEGDTYFVNSYLEEGFQDVEVISLILETLGGGLMGK